MNYEFEKEPFREYGLNSQEKALTINTKWNMEECDWLKQGMLILRQTKKGTAIKQLAEIGFAKVLQDKKIIENSLDNYRKNERLQLGAIEKTIEKAFEK